MWYSQLGCVVVDVVDVVVVVTGFIVVVLVVLVCASALELSRACFSEKVCTCGSRAACHPSSLDIRR